ncbi:c-type cytochrome [Dyadobacter tibetensis]|uniref:c-type cytochrome n=1 Tax=Dyadobacter tibetensis TaxID=1211851 RepID=UPI00046F6C4E|nr:c-type cytochrome [Dyadobacter tibetensis]
MKKITQIILLIMAVMPMLKAQESPKEEDFYKIVTPPIPEGIILEVGGLITLPNGSLAISTRRGEVWIVDNPTSSRPHFKKFASGLHEVLGLAYKEGALYCAQRGELTKLVDKNGDGTADVYETVYAWPLSGHYHEYSFGPKLAEDGSFFVSGNVAFGDEEWWRGESRVPGRGWIFHITNDGKFEPWATGVRSPAGISMINNELWYTDNQGDWMGTGGIFRVKKGDFMGHPAGLRWAELPNSPVKLTEKQFFAERDNRQNRDANNRAIKPENIIDEKPEFLYQLKEKYDMVRLPAVWLPYGVHGVSTAELILDDTEGAFGPFAGQIFVGDQGQSNIMRVVLEEVKGEYQGASIGFRSGFQSGVLRMAFDKDGSMFVGETNRGWGSAGDANQGLQRLVWNGKMPFEMYTVKAKPDGFEITFTMPVDRKSAEDLSSYAVSSYLYKHFPVYGSPMVNTEELNIKGVKVSEDGKTVRIVVDGMRQYYVHKISLDGVRAANNYWSLVHPDAYYTLNNFPDGEKLKASEMKTTRSATTKSAPATPAKTHVSPDGKGKEGSTAAAAAPTWEDVKPLLQKNTCLACHTVDKKVVGPSYQDIAKRKYTNQQIVDLIYSPKPENWPDYATPMAPMPHVPKAEAAKIAAWINTLAK